MDRKDRENSYQERLAGWERARFAPPPEKPLNPIEPSMIKMMPMRDGTRLYTEIFYSSSAQAAPVILVRSPYPYGRASRNGRQMIERYLQNGYVFVFQLTRGQGLSEGQFHFFRDDINDGFDCIEWLARQNWCNGKVGMQGASYAGGTQLLVARAKPSALKCIMPTAFVGHYTRCFPFSCGVPSKGPYMQWHQVLDAERSDDLDMAYCDMTAVEHPIWGTAFRKQPLVDAANELLNGDKLANWQEIMANPTDNEYWRDIHFTDKQLGQLDIPIFFTDGWYDTTIGPIDFFTRLEQFQSGRKDRYLLVGPWDHYQTGAASQPGDDNGDRILPNNAAIDHVEHRLAFFDRYLKDDGSSLVQEARVRVYVTGSSDTSANRWFNLSTFPAPNTQHKKLYLHSLGNAHSFPSDGMLSVDEPKDEPVDTYVYDPSLPTASIARSGRDRRVSEIRSDVLTYTSEPLVAPVTILGDIILVLHAASSGFDTDWFALLTEVYPDGQSKSFHYAPPAFRARYRKGLDREILLTPNQPEEYRIPLGPAGHQIAAGHRLRLSIFSAAFPEYDPNTNTGKPAATDTEMRLAHQTIYHNTDRPSHLILPVFADC